MDLNQFAKEVHENAVAHGWWEGDRETDEILALIHSEWSEALEEYRAGRPMLWHKCPYNSGMCENQDVHGGEYDCQACTPEKRKPEGIAVELMDGCIRILDFFVTQDVEMPDELALDEFGDVDIGESVPSLVCFLHGMTARCLIEDDLSYLGGAIGMAMFWVQKQGVDPFALLKEKHEYNKTRPYKHGGKVC